MRICDLRIGLRLNDGVKEHYTSPHSYLHSTNITLAYLDHVIWPTPEKKSNDRRLKTETTCNERSCSSSIGSNIHEYSLY